MLKILAIALVATFFAAIFSLPVNQPVNFDLVNCTESCVESLPECPDCGYDINQCIVTGKCDGFFTGCMECVLKASVPCGECGAGIKRCFKGCQ